MMLFETHAPDAPRPAGPHDGAALAPLHAPLDDALHLLQADPGHSLADPGLARLTPAGLDRLFVAARRQADRSHQGILLLQIPDGPEHEIGLPIPNHNVGQCRQSAQLAH